MVAAAVIGSAVVGGVMSSQSQKSAANTAAGAQTQASQAGIAERQGEFDRVQSLLNPFVQAATGRPGMPSGGTYTARSTAPAAAPGLPAPAPALGSPQPLGGSPAPSSVQFGSGYLPAITVAPGTFNAVNPPPGAAPANYGPTNYAPTSYAPGDPMAGAGGDYGGGPATGGSLGAQQDVIGLNGPDAQQAAIDNLQRMPAFTSALKLGENRIMQNAAATGGLRGGNTQGALAYFAPQLLAQQINDYYGRLAGITSLGQNAAAMVGNAGMQTGAGISDLMQQGGSAQAGAALAGGRAQSNLYSSMSGALGQYVGMGGGFGSGYSPDAIQGSFAQTSAGSSGFGTGVAYGNQDYGAYL